MPGILRLVTRHGIAASLLFGCFVTAGTTAGAAPGVETLRALRPVEVGSAPALAAGAIRNRAIGLDLATIGPETPARSVVTFELFDDVVFQATRRDVRVLEPGRWSWVGALADEPLGVVQFAVRDGVASGVIRSPERGVFRVRFTGEPGVYIAEEINTASFKPCATGPAQSVAAPIDFETNDPATTGAADERGFSVTTIDALVGYTAAARTLAGGTAGMLAEIDLAIASANLAYQNSNIDINLNLALTYLASYNETGNALTDLANWKGTSDGAMDSVHEQRDDIAADVCALIVSDFNACGIGHLMTVPSSAFENRAFTVTAFGCAVSNLSFAHELGHNLGCAHDRDNASTGAYSYSFGYRDPIGSADWRTIMAYAPGVRIQYFSNPLISYQGQLTGVLSGSNAADNSKTQGRTRAYAENWRDASTRRPIRFDLTSPVNGQAYVWGAQEFNWQQNGPVDSYSLIVATDPGLNDVVYRADGLLDSSHTIPAGALGECSTYYWGIEATLSGNSRMATTPARVFSTRLVADVNADGVVDTADLGGLVGSFGSTNTFADLNYDGAVDTADLGILIGSYGRTCSP